MDKHDYMIHGRTSDKVLTALFAACIVFQLFIPHSIGLANNGDFGKMIGRFSLGPETHDTSEEYRYFTARWLYDRSFQWMPENLSSELIPISAALFIGWWVSNQAFDIRILGAIHASLWIACFALFLPLLRGFMGWRRFLAGLLALFMFADVSYIAYFNSFYADVAGFLFLAWSLVIWLRIITSQPKSWGLLAAFGAATLLCVASKPQHALLGVFLAALAVLAVCCLTQRSQRAAAVVLAALILFVAVVTVQRMPNAEGQTDQYHVIFWSILHKSPTPLADAAELGLGEEYLRYVDYWAQRPEDDPLENPEWRISFTSRTNLARISFFYLRHPWRTAAIIYRVIHDQARFRRPSLGNYRSSSGFPPGTLARSFGWWSALRSAMFRIAPWHILIWYAAVLVVGLRVWIKPHANSISRIGLFAFLLAGMGVVELGVSALADAAETDRHLFLFHAITDFTIMLAVVWALGAFQGRAGLPEES